MSSNRRNPVFQFPDVFLNKCPEFVLFDPFKGESPMKELSVLAGQPVIPDNRSLMVACYLTDTANREF
jgi:hypothetical protein